MLNYIMQFCYHPNQYSVFLCYEAIMAVLHLILRFKKKKKTFVQLAIR